MCRYAFTDYKSHFACFSCRKTFKKIAIVDFVKRRGLDRAYEKLSWVHTDTAQRRKLQEEFGTTYDEIRALYFREVGACPHCGQTMAAMGLDFRAPSMADHEAWTIIETLYEHGFAFMGCGCSVGYAPPKKLSDLQEFFSEHERRSEGEELLAAISGKCPQ